MHMARKRLPASIDAHPPRYSGVALSLSQEGGRWFESGSLQQTVRLSLDFSFLYRKAGSCRGVRGPGQAARSAEKSGERIAFKRDRNRHIGHAHSAKTSAFISTHQHTCQQWLCHTPRCPRSRKRQGQLSPTSPLYRSIRSDAASSFAIFPAPSINSPNPLSPDPCEDLQRFARELCARHRAEPAQTAVKWQALSPSAELMVSPERRTWCAVRDTRTPGADRFRWTVAVPGQLDPVAEGRAKGGIEAFGRRGGGSSPFRGPGRTVRRWECGR
jgi:hypothetical protein